MALVVIDTSLPEPLRLGQVVDFAAMVGLADIDLDEDVGDVPSILRLLTRFPDAPPGLTRWDQAFLGSLYATDQGSRIQRSQIVLRMLSEINR